MRSAMPVALLGDGSEPTCGRPSRVRRAFEQMGHQDGQPIADFAPVATRHAFELLGDIFEIEVTDLTASCPSRLVLEPGDKILVVDRCVGRSSHLHPPLPTCQTANLNAPITRWTGASNVILRPWRCSTVGPASSEDGLVAMA